jgi:hypothetical protein
MTTMPHLGDNAMPLGNDAMPPCNNLTPLGAHSVSWMLRSGDDTNLSNVATDAMVGNDARLVNNWI